MSSAKDKSRNQSFKKRKKRTPTVALPSDRYKEKRGIVSKQNENDQKVASNRKIDGNYIILHGVNGNPMLIMKFRFNTEFFTRQF